MRGKWSKNGPKMVKNDVEVAAPAAQIGAFLVANPRQRDRVQDAAGQPMPVRAVA